jgi:hypothetical protein
MNAVVAPYEKVSRDMQKKAQQSKITSFFTKSLSCLHNGLYIVESHDTFQPGTHAIQINTNKNGY